MASEIEFDSQLYLEHVSQSSGVYQMFDSNAVLLYVGKAKNIKKRLSSYFHTKGLSVKTRHLVKQIADIQCIETHTEKEALLLEHTLIKAHRPKYNILLRDGKTYPYIRIDDTHDFPSVQFYRGKKTSSSRYFGPYPNTSAIRDTLLFLQKILPIRQCDDVFFKHRTRPCLQYQIQRCSAPCVGYITKKEYQKLSNMSALFLSGKDKTLNTWLQNNMKKAAKEQAYEKAAQWRDRIQSLQAIQSHQYIENGFQNCDIFHLTSQYELICIEVGFVRAGRYTGSRGYFPKIYVEQELVSILQNFILQFYYDTPIPDEVLVNLPTIEKEFIEQYLHKQNNKKVTIKNVVRSQRKQWMLLTKKSAQKRVLQKQQKQQNISSSLASLTQLLAYKKPITHIECFDISHTAGENTVASCVVLTEQGLENSLYRRYNIQNITPGDDYAAMQQVIQRRYNRIVLEEKTLPDVILIDGGKGQLSSVAHILSELNLLDKLLLLGVAKGLGRKPGLETLFIYPDKTGIQFSADANVLHLIQLIRDEAHRFAIAGHRAKRTKSYKQSLLEEIPGIGKKRKKQLLEYFGGLQGLKKAAIEDIMQIKGIHRRLAKQIYHYLKE